MHTFENLKDTPIEELEAIRDQVRDELAAERQKRWDIIASILFYQDQIRKESRI